MNSVDPFVYFASEPSHETPSLLIAAIFALQTQAAEPQVILLKLDDVIARARGNEAGFGSLVARA